MQTSNAETGIYKTGFPDNHESLLPYVDIQPAHVTSAWVLLCSTSVGFLGTVITRFLTNGSTVSEWSQSITIAPLTLTSLWLCFFLGGLIKSLLGRRDSNDAGDTFRFDLFVSSLKVSAAGTVYCAFWLLVLILVALSFDTRLPIALAFGKLASSHFVFAGLFRSKVETCLANILVGAAYISLGIVLYINNGEDVFNAGNIVLWVSFALMSLLGLVYKRWLISASLLLVSSSFMLGASMQSRYAMAVSLIAALVLFLISAIPTAIDDLSSLVAMLFGSWASRSSFSSAVSSGLMDPPSVAEGEPLLTERSEQFIVIKN